MLGRLGGSGKRQGYNLFLRVHSGLIRAKWGLCRNFLRVRYCIIADAKVAKAGWRWRGMRLRRRMPLILPQIPSSSM